MFVVTVFFIPTNHEPWRDEAHAWNIARESEGISSVLGMASYEGSPVLWHTVLYPFAKAGLPYITMALVNLAIIFLAVLLIVFRSPFRRYQKFMLVFSYFFAYEYAAIARSYAMSCFLIFLVAVFYGRRFDRPMIYLLAVFFLANTNLHSYVISLILVGVYLVDLLFVQKWDWRSPWARRILIACFLVFFVPFIQLIPHSDNTYSKLNFSLNPEHFAVVPVSVMPAFFPMPVLDVHFWNTNIFYDDYGVVALLGIPIYLLSLFVLFDRKRLDGFVIYLFSTLALFAIFFVKYVGGMRHKGFIFLLFFFALWINMTNKKPMAWNSLKNGLEADYFAFVRRLSGNSFFRRMGASRKRISSAFVFVVLVVNFCAFVTAAYYEVNHDFSDSLEVSEYIKGNNISEKYFVAAYGVEALLPYFDEGSFYCIGLNDYCSFSVASTRYDVNLTQSFDVFMEDYDGDKEVALVIGGGRYVGFLESSGCVLFGAFNESISGEYYYVFRCGHRNI